MITTIPAIATMVDPLMGVAGATLPFPTTVSNCRDRSPGFASSLFLHIQTGGCPIKRNVAEITAWHFRC